MIKRASGRGVFFLLVALFFVACTSNKESTRAFSFAVSGEFRPFSYVDEKGELTGFDVEIGRLIAEQIERQPKVVKYKFAGIVEGLKAGRFDAAVASQTITQERKKHVNFTKPYYFSGPHVFSRQKVDRIALKGLELAVSKGSTYLKQAKEYSDKIKVYDSDITALDALSRGRHDAVITDSIAGATAIKKGLNIHPNQSLGKSEQGISVAKENSQLLSEVNKALESLRESGELERVSKKYFGKDITRQGSF